MRLKSEVRVQAWLRRAQGLGLMATVARKGEAESGAILVKVLRAARRCDVFTPVTAPDGSPAWLRALPEGGADEREADAYLARQAKYDGDMWVVEIEDPKGVFELGETVLKA
jgi:GMP synthase (glutamine-hydrolysing)